MRQAYDLDALRVADFNGVIAWAIRQGAEWFLGPVVGAAFADAVLSQWSVLDPPDYWV